MKRAVHVTIHALLIATREQPGHADQLLRQALRLAQQALAQQADDREAIRCLGLLWWRLGARRRGWALVSFSYKLQATSYKLQATLGLGKPIKFPRLCVSTELLWERACSRSEPERGKDSRDAYRA